MWGYHNIDIIIVSTSAYGVKAYSKVKVKTFDRPLCSFLLVANRINCFVELLWERSEFILLYKHIAKPVLFRMDAERAHHLVIDGMHTAEQMPGGLALLRSLYGVEAASELAVEAFGIPFSNPIGLAAGLDKNAKAPLAFSSIGFGFIEVGTVTPKPQSGNDLPRLFRLPEDYALINRMGFNNEGAAAMAGRLSRLKHRSIPIAVNIGKNKVTPNEQAEEDYRACIRALYTYGDFFVVNISSPNTPDLRNLQHGDELKSLLAAVDDEMSAQAQKIGGQKKQMLVKIAPDVNDPQLDYMIEAIASSRAAGIIATNTTVSRAGLTHSNAKEAGGLSGKPLRNRATDVIRRIYRMTEGKLPIIGSGGVFSAEDAYEKIKAGASLVEIYTGLIYQGPRVVRDIHHGLRALIRQDGYRNIMDAVGTESSSS